MRKLAAYIGVSLDGFYEGAQREFDFFTTDEEFFKFSVEQLDSADTLVLGRVTYEGMAAYWPSLEAVRDAPVIAGHMNEKPKLVVSTTLNDVAWAGAEIVKGDLAQTLTEHKTRPGRDLLVLGSPTLTANLAHLGLLDELRIMVNPVGLGAGKSLFTSMSDRLQLNLLSIRQFESGNVLLTYVPLPKPSAK